MSDAFVIDVQLASDVEASAPTTVGIVNWTNAELDLNAATDVYVEFGLDTTYGTRAPGDPRTLLLGLKPLTTYHFRVVVETAAGRVTSEDKTVTTGEPTTLVNLESFEVKDDATREKGFIVTSFWRGNGSSVIFILDSDGDVVWWYDTGMDGVARARMSATGKNMWMIEPDNMGAPIARVSMDTLDSQTYGQVVGSHDLTPVEGETMAYLDYGESDCDSIFEITPEGDTEEIWDSQDVATAMCHGNALRYSKTEDVYTFSDVTTDIWVVSRAGEYQWGLADLVEGGVSAWGGRNHGHHLLDDSIIIFANAGGGMMVSTVVEYDLSGNEIFEYDGGAFSANLGDVQRLPGGNTLVTYSNDGIIHEITAEQEVVLEIHTTSQSFGYALWRESLYGEPSELEL